MNAPLSLEAFRRATEDARHTVDTAGAQRWEWRHHYGTMLIEVRGGEVFVDHRKVETVGRVAPSARRHEESQPGG